MTVGRLKKEMSMSEYFDWIAFYQLQSGESDNSAALEDGSAMLKEFNLG